MTLAGAGFAEGVTVTVGGAAARVVSAEAGAVRFEMPSVAGAPGSRQDVVASIGERRTKALPLYLGRVPLVVSFEPARGVAGDLVRSAGPGTPTAGGNVVTFDGVPALVVVASPTEMALVLPRGGATAAGNTRPGGRARPGQDLVGRPQLPSPAARRGHLGAALLRRRRGRG